MVLTEPCICTIYDRIFAGIFRNSLPKILYKHRVYMVLTEPCMCTVYDRIFGDFLDRYTVYTPYIHGSNQPYSFSSHADVFVS